MELFPDILEAPEVVVGEVPGSSEENETVQIPPIPDDISIEGQLQAQQPAPSGATSPECVLDRILNIPIRNGRPGPIPLALRREIRRLKRMTRGLSPETQIKRLRTRSFVCNPKFLDWWTRQCQNYQRRSVPKYS
uniref:Uncharacterized protein n=1 Tax=Bracon brevicornis TaxID=1563983 RepID=A0A6V7JDZ3_9HYME